MSKEEMVEDWEFTCPECGSHAFGTANGEGYCHGYVTEKRELGRHETSAVRPCKFKWPRNEEADKKCFKGIGKFRPRVQTAQVVLVGGTRR